MEHIMIQHQEPYPSHIHNHENFKNNHALPFQSIKILKDRFLMDKISLSSFIST